MKLNVIPCVIAVLASALVAFGLYNWCRFVDMNLLIAIFGGISMVLTFGTMIGVSFAHGRTSVNIKMLSGITSGLILISNVIFCCLNSFSYAVYIITNGLLLLIWLLAVYGIVNADTK